MSAPSTELPIATQQRRLGTATILLAIFLAWLPIQTPLAVLVFQYGHAEILARAMLLAKDVFTAVLILYFFVRYWQRLRFYWFDWAAIVYVVLIGVYSIVPWLLGSHIAVVSVVASVRELIVPVELYALGRLALTAGADARWLVKWFLAVAAVAAAFTLCVWVFLPASFWSSTMDLVSFVRVVQGIPNAHTIWDISLVAHFGGGPSDIFARAVGPFTQPVGTAHYFVLPLSMCVAFGFQALNQGNRRGILVAVIMSALLAGAVIAPISRGSWMAAGLAGLLLALIYRRPVIIVVALLIAGAILVAVPASRNSIAAVFKGTDASSAGHVQAVDAGIKTVVQNPLGLGVGQSGQFGQVLASEDTNGTGVGENMYLELLISVGPLGFLAFVAWMFGLLWRLAWVRHRAPPPSWMVVGTGAALLGYIASAMLASPLMRFTTSASVWLVVGLCTGLMLAAPCLEKGTGTIGEGRTGAASPAI